REVRSRSGSVLLRGVDRVYDDATAGAVLAFEKVHGLPRTRAVTRRFWRVLRASGPPPRIRSGNHIEVDKTLQVLYEVPHGEVVLFRTCRLRRAGTLRSATDASTRKAWASTPRPCMTRCSSSAVSRSTAIGRFRRTP